MESSTDSKLESSGKTASARVLGLDNLRAFLTVFVVLGHTLCAYCGYLGWWYVRDPADSALVDASLVVIATVVIPALFFVAGYVFRLSIARHGAASYWRERLGRLGLPWLVFTLVMSPLLTYLWSLQRGVWDAGYLAYLRAFFAGYGVPFAGIFNEFEPVSRHYLWWHHLWFIPNLLLTTLLATIYLRWTAKRRASDPTWPGSTVGVVLRYGVLSLIGVAALSAWMPDYQLKSVVLSNLIAVQPTRFVIHGAAFFTGMLLARNRDGLAGFPLVNSRGVYVVAALSLLGYLALLGPIQITTPVPLALHLGEGVAIVVTSWAAVAATLRLGLTRLNRRIGWLEQISPYALQIYFIHYPLCVLGQLALLQVPLPVVVKVSLVFGFSLWASFFLSRLSARLSARSTVFAALALQVAVVFLT